jgi:cytochrome P450
MLLKNPSKMQKLAEELDQALADLPRNEIPKHASLKTLPYLNAVINEALRLWPITLGKFDMFPASQTFIGFNYESLLTFTFFFVDGGN